DSGWRDTVCVVVWDDRIFCVVAGLYQFYESFDGEEREAGEGGGHPEDGGIDARAADRYVLCRVVVDGVDRFWVGVRYSQAVAAFFQCRCRQEHRSEE